MRTVTVWFISIAAVFLLAACLPAAGQPMAYEGYDPDNGFTTEVLLNKPGVAFDLGALNDSGAGMNVAFDKWEGGGPYYIYRSHYHPDLAVVVYDTRIVNLDGLSVSLIIPTEWRDVNETAGELVPSVGLDPGELDWGQAMTAELEWLSNASVIVGLGPDDIAGIAARAGPGYAGWESRILYFEQTWMPRNETPLLLLVPGPATGFTIGEEDLPQPENHPGHEGGYFFWVIIITAAVVVLLVLGVFSYTRLKRRSILDNLNRKNIFEHIRQNPGVHFRELLRELNFKPGAMSYHLNVLEKGEFIRSTQDGNYRRYYLHGVKSDLKIALNQMQLRILSIVDERPGISQAKIAEKVGKNRMVVNYHIRILADADILAVEKSGRENRIYKTKNTENYLTG